MRSSTVQIKLAPLVPLVRPQEAIDDTLKAKVLGYLAGNSKPLYKADLVHRLETARLDSSKLANLLTALTDSRFIDKIGQAYSITDSGQDHLSTLPVPETKRGRRPTSTTIQSTLSQDAEKLKESILRYLAKGSQYFSTLKHNTKSNDSDLIKALSALIEEGVITQSGRTYSLVQDKKQEAPVAPVKAIAIATVAIAPTAPTFHFTAFSDDQLHLLAALSNAPNKKTTREIFIALCTKVNGIKDPEVQGSHLKEMNEILKGLAKDGLINFTLAKPFNLSTIAAAGRALVESWHASTEGSKFKTLNYWD